METKPLDADIVCVGFGPAAGGFLTTVTRGIRKALEAGETIESRAMPGMPPQIVCYERADDIAFGVSGVVTRARAIRASFPELDPAEIPLAAPVRDEKLLYLLDPHGASRRPAWMKLADKALEACGARDFRFTAPFTPTFLRKHDGFILSLGQFNQWVGQQVMMSGLAQIWPATPVADPLVEDGRINGVVLAQDGTEVRAALTVVADGPVGPVGRRIDEIFGMPPGHQRDEWAVGMKMVVDLPDACTLEEGTVFHTIGYPEPEIFGFFYVHPGRIASAGIFVPSWLESPARTGYRYLQQFLTHPAIWEHIEGGRMRSWGAKSLLESGRRGEPWLAGEGYARIGEGSGSTNVLTGSGVDEAWFTGVLLGEAVLQAYRQGLPFTAEVLRQSYIAGRRASWLDKENLAAERARNGFQCGLFSGFLGMGLAGFTGGAYGLPRPERSKKTKSLEDFFVGRLSRSQIARIKEECRREAKPLHDALMDACGWPAVPFDGKLLVSHQDALLMGGKVQAPAEFPDHVVFREESVCQSCGTKTCIEICSGEAIHVNAEHPEGVPAFDREKCIHCGVCLWNCDRSNISFCAAPGGLHSAEN